MSKLLDRGYSLEDVIEAVTSHPAEMFHLSSRGRMEKGYCGDFTIFKIIEEPKEVVDSKGKKVMLRRYIQPVAVILRNQYIQL